MSTPTTPEQAREIASILFFPNGNNGYALRSLAEQVEALTAERDAYAAAADSMAASHKVERDGLLALHTEQINYTVKTVAERDALKDAARLALDALEKSTRYFNIVRLGESRLKDSEVRGDCHTAMNALKAVL